MSDELEAHIGAGTLVLADRGLWGLARWHRFRDRGAHLLWRIERRAARRVQDVLPDGSYLALIQANKHAKAAGTVKAPPALVRVIEYRVDGQADVVRLVTSLTDHEEYPAAELATLYARRWEIEIVFDEIKTHQRGRPVLRSQTPDGGRQEIYAHLIVHHATRDLLNDQPPRVSPLPIALLLWAQLDVESDPPHVYPLDVIVRQVEAVKQSSGCLGRLISLG
ncbi:IS4 family transposase [Streptomyces sp. NPDC058466]|uniref:IS4 family transposase n=1 Tax=Streptomyces sp. NPDC058466 TaxID=3346512 RepID=UPI0036691066